jgi:glycosyltransferase involved in cell wall biosynthesis
MPEGSATSPENIRNESSETLFNPRSVAIVTGTFYPGWYEGDARDPLSVDKLRGDLALQSFRSAQQQNFQLVVVDGGSSEAFKKSLEQNGTYFEMQKETGGAGPARRQGLNHAESISGVKVICQTEPEKISIVSDCIKIASAPILRSEADIVVPKRNEESFSTYPKYQVEQEQKANKLYNQILRSRGLLKENDPDLDFWIGARFIANKPHVTDLFKKTYQYRKDNTTLDKRLNVDMYSNPLFFPIVEALYKGLRVKSIEVPYKHPQAQTAFEDKNPSFDRRRGTQKRTIVAELVNFIRYLENSPKTRLSKSK